MNGKLEYLGSGYTNDTALHSECLNSVGLEQQDVRKRRYENMKNIKEL